MIKNIIAGNINVGNLEGVGPLGTNLISSDDAGATRLVVYLNVLFQVLIVIASIYTLFNFIIAGYQFISAGNDAKKIQDATAKIWQSIVGLLIVAGSFLIAALIGFLIFKDPDALLNPRILLP